MKRLFPTPLPQQILRRETTKIALLKSLVAVSVFASLLGASSVANAFAEPFTGRGIDDVGSSSRRHVKPNGVAI